MGCSGYSLSLTWDLKKVIIKYGKVPLTEPGFKMLKK